VTRAYAHHFRPSRYLETPRASIAVFVICADTEAAALRLVQSRNLWIVRSRTGVRGAYPTVAEAEAHLYTPRELAILERNRDRTVVGAPEQVRERLLALGAAYGVDEFVVVTITEDYASRLRSYELLVEVFGIASIDPQHPRAPD